MGLEDCEVASENQQCQIAVLLGRGWMAAQQRGPVVRRARDKQELQHLAESLGWGVWCLRGGAGELM